MSEYVVKWQLEIEADSHQEAAMYARKIQLDPNSEATFFYVALADSEGRGSRKLVEVDTLLEDDWHE